jgi:hypothetical protein
MPVKIFTAAGNDKIRELELEINRWATSLRTLRPSQSVKQISTALSPIRESGIDQKTYQYLVITVPASLQIPEVVPNPLDGGAPRPNSPEAPDHAAAERRRH